MRRVITILMMVLLTTVVVQGQIKIGGNVYGGGNKGKVDGNTRVTVKAGDIGAVDNRQNNVTPVDNPRGRVFGGARMADVGGNAFVNIDGENATDYIVINHVYGGNDVAGTIGTSPENKKMPSNLTEVIAEPTQDQLQEAAQTREQWRAAQKAANPKKNDIDKTWDSYVRISTGTKKTYIGQLFGGGNGEFTYTDANGKPLKDDDGNFIVKEGETIIAKKKTEFTKPELGKAYLEVVGGSIVYAYGGGNNATVTDQTVIHVDNPSDVVNHILVNTNGIEAPPATYTTYKENIENGSDELPEGYTDLLSTARFLEMGINTTFSKPSSDEFQIGRFFGGNNKAEMAIRPTWNLQGGKIRNLYSGGNQGDMTSSDGLLLEIDPVSSNTNPLIIDYVYGGCRMANVRPMLNGQITTVANLPGYFFPPGLSARTLVRGGDINNVFGGNDVTGRVYGGNAVGIYTSIRGDVYGGGNGAYPYTDNWYLKDSPTYGDLYYGERGDTESTFTDAFASLSALNAYRPNAEQVSIRLAGTDANNPTIVGGSVYCGGNCATLVPSKDNPMVELKIGSYAIADKVFLGNNGEGMVDKDILKHYQYGVLTENDALPEGKKVGDVVASGGTDFSIINLASETPDGTSGKKQFDIYMDGAAMGLMPSVVFDQMKENGTGDPANYLPYSSQIGSFYCGGNVGSMTYSKKINISFDREVVIYDKVVGGCNDANIPVIMDGETPLNTAYYGGVLGTTTDGNKLELTFSGLKIEPQRLYMCLPDLTTLNEGKTYYTYDADKRIYSPFKATGSEPNAGSQNTDGSYNDYYTLGSKLEWNTVKWDTNRNAFVQIDQVSSGSDVEDDNTRRLQGGNIYGGCFHSGHIDGNVVINIEADLMEKDKLFNASTTGVILEEQSEDMMSVALSVFGAGYGKDSEIWGSTTVNLKNEAYAFQIFGGGEKGVVGKKVTKTKTVKDDDNNDVVVSYQEYTYDPKYSTTVNLAGSTDGSETANTAETQYIYGGGNEGLICGDVIVNLGNGRVNNDVFAGSSNADILGHTEVYIGGYGDWKTVGTDKALDIKAKGFPWINENVYAGNDFGGLIKGKGVFKSLLSEERMSMVYDGDKSTGPDKTAFREDLLEPNTFLTYIQGRVDGIYGGNYGSYDYTDNMYNAYVYTQKDYSATNPLGTPKGEFKYPHFDNSFIYFHPTNIQGNQVNTIFGGCEGKAGYRLNNYMMQERSYVLIDDAQTDNPDRYAATDVYGGGAFAGLGSNDNIGGGRSAIDLFAGRFNNVYGGCNREGMMGYNRINVPSGSTIQVNALYGGGKGYVYYGPESTENEAGSDPSAFCDNYATCINYQSSTAAVENGIYGGNRNLRIACDTYINIGTALKNREGKLGTVYGAGYGDRSVSGRTNIFLNTGAQVNEVYGGGRDGNVFNFPSLKVWLRKKYEEANTAAAQINDKIVNYATLLGSFEAFVKTDGNAINLPSDMIAQVPDIMTNPNYHNTNVHIMAGAKILGNPRATGGTDGGYAYAGGLGENAVVAGETYIELKGGYVEKDIYAGGTSGPVFDEHKLGMTGENGFVPKTIAYIESGSCRNVYGGGWRGDVGFAKYQDGSKVLYEEKDDYGTVIKTYKEQIPDFNHSDDQFRYLGESHVIIGKIGGTSYMNGIPTVRRNVYGGGEGGAIYGTAYVTINNGYIGYSAVNIGTESSPIYEFVEELDDYQEGDRKLEKHGGNVFGGGYVANSYVDHSNVKMYGGIIRGGLFGGGEIGPIGRGTVKEGTQNQTYPSHFEIGDAKIYKAGSTRVEMFGGHVKRNVFGGGRGYDNWETYGWMSKIEQATMDQSSKGYVFGNTEVFIHGGEIGTKDATSLDDGNVFGGGDEGFVYSATGAKSSTDGYYYNGSTMTEDCKVVIAPSCPIKNIRILTNITRVKDAETQILYNAGDYISSSQFESLTASEKAGYGTVWNYDNTISVQVGSKTYYPITADQNKENPSQAFAPVEDLNSLTEASPQWNSLDKTGIDIRNAVFAGGNISAGSDKMSVNTTTVFGNATASVIDVFNNDFITIGEDGIGGLYGDGNLTFVDGYRELNITNYGTDYYHLNQSLSLSEYSKLSDRERAYFELLYIPKTAHDVTYYECKGTHQIEINGVKRTYKFGQKIPESEYNQISGIDGESAKWSAKKTTNYNPELTTSRITEDEYNLFWQAEKANWEQYGFCTLYAGRMINTIQRADFCGVFGSRVVMRGAQDRVPKTVDFTEYTINRVKELSLNQVEKNNTNHGNYFGIYNVVNYLGALTSDVTFSDVRKTENIEKTYDKNFEGETYYDWKRTNLGNRKRNNGSSENEVALASGVWLELLDEQTEVEQEKVYGPITGIVQLTLINVAPGEGGGYVYAKNEHGFRHSSGENQITLATANFGARSHKMYRYDPPLSPVAAENENINHRKQLTTDSEGREPGEEGYVETYEYDEGYPINPKMQSSGNFVNSFKRIIDDCYPQNGAYYGPDAAPAHYWYIRGDYYVYDQYISAYTGSARAYPEGISIPLSITAEAQGRLKLQEIQQSYYAYWVDIHNIDPKYLSKTDSTAILVGNKTYHLNDPISYWDYKHLTTAEQELFAPETWVCSNDATFTPPGQTAVTYHKGDVFTSRPYDIYVCKDDIKFKDSDEHDVTYYKGTVLTKVQYEAIPADNKYSCAAVFNITNAVSSENGFLLTFDWDNPDVWNDYYHAETYDSVVKGSLYNSTDYPNYMISPTFNFGIAENAKSVLGQIAYSEGNIIDKATYTLQASVSAHVDSSKQAEFEEAYIVTATENFTAGNGLHYVPNACIPVSTYNEEDMASDRGKFDKAVLCTNTFEYKTHATDTESSFIVAGTVIPLGNSNDPEPGTYNYLVTEAAKANSSIPDPSTFFSTAYICKTAGLWGGTLFTGGKNYPALDYSNLSAADRENFNFNYDALDLLVGQNYIHPNTEAEQYGHNVYATEQRIDYEATYTGSSPLTLTDKTVTLKGSSNATNTIQQGDVLDNVNYESLTNEAANYSQIVISGEHPADTTYYVVKDGFAIGDRWYSPGNQMTGSDYYNHVYDTDKQNKVVLIPYGNLITTPLGKNDTETFYFCTKAYGDKQAGDIIGVDEYNNLTNEQKNFSISGKIPTETSTLYVARDVDINDLSKDRIITAIYYYDYLESDESGNSYEKIREYHVVNVHVHFESGMPTIGELLPPSTVLPGNLVNLNQPTVTKGAYELLGGGWELYEKESDARSHQNGVPFHSGTTPLYWYQDGYYMAYYALSYLGKTYSNAVPLSVANYHRMNDVIDITENETTHLEEVSTKNHYMYLNEAVKNNKRDPKVYIKNDIELKKLGKFFDETLTKSELEDVEECKNIDFIIDGDIAHHAAWTPIGTDAKCFEGTLHGDGHTISGLNNSLFYNLCGDVYNLGVTGTFSGAGVVEKGTGYVENCWISTTSDKAKTSKPIFGDPTRSGDDLIQIVNSYYMEDDDAATTVASNNVEKMVAYPVHADDTHGKPIRKSAQAFYNGEVAYDLNGFYLYKRFSDKETQSGTDTEYQYKTKTATGLSDAIKGYYGSSPTNCSSGYHGAKYVEDRYLDGDFRYAGGNIPTATDDRRVFNELAGKEEFYPIWPDDYLFFGQKLTYGYSIVHQHQSQPSVIVRDGGLLPNPAESELSNRVYRAPAYYRSKNMGVAHFNPWAYLVATSKDGKDAYPNMTAIDFAGHNDNHNEETKNELSYMLGYQKATPYDNIVGGAFYPPLLDDDGLQQIISDETRNLLVYAPAASAESGYANATTYATLRNYFQDPSYDSFDESSDNYNDGNDYGRVASAADVINSIHGHLVLSNRTADTDHLLVDKQDFNAPFAYTFNSGKRMWYQRVPENYVETDWDALSVRSTKGWEGVSLPFITEIVATDQKGELTHFYGNSTTGHEYWLREFNDIAAGPVANTVKANMNKLAAAGTSKSVSNTFLWDYYYQGVSHGHNDENADEYQTYYKEQERSYSGYPYQQAATPYIIGFPSKQYYEFDLSGKFKATTTADYNPVQLEQQTITFASLPGTTIHVSDNETNGVKQSDGQKDYIFKPSYMNEVLSEGTYVLNSDGNAYSKLADAETNTTNKVTTSQYAFRPYFTVTAVSQGSSPKMIPEHIVFGDNTNNMEGELISTLTGDIDIFVRGHKIIAVSHRKDAVPVRIVNVAGVVVADFILPALDTVITPVSIEGIYIANKRKLLVK